MNKQEVIIKEIQRLTKEKVLPTSNIKDLKVDSLDLVELVIDAEKRFSISITDDEITQINTVQDFIDLVNQK